LNLTVVIDNKKIELSQETMKKIKDKIEDKIKAYALCEAWHKR
jgi:hypothetical protein